MKKRTFLEGNVIFPLIAGQRASISYNGGIMRTSRVEKIYEVSESKVIIETLNTIYCVAPVYTNEIASYVNQNTALFV